MAQGLVLEYLAHDTNEITVEMRCSNGYWCEVRKCVYKRINRTWKWWSHDDPPSMVHKLNIQNALSELFVNCKGLITLN